jgi:DNA-binding GntR family transcriptional regulator
MMSMSQPGRPRQSFRELRALLEALKAGEAARAAQLSTDHIVAARASAFKALRDREASRP